MPSLAQRVSDIKPSPTMAISDKAAERKRQGRDVIPLSLGEPDFQTPDNIKAAGIAAIERNFTKYTAADGFRGLKDAIASKLARENGTTFSADQIVVGSGAKIVIHSAIMAVVGPGDEVVIPAPYWVTYPELVQLADGTPVFATGREESGFKVTPEILEKSLSPRTRAIIFNSPNNPSGAVYSADEIAALGSVLKRYPDVWIITDELYEHLVFDGQRAPSFVEIMPELADRIITINGFSKGYVMTGWRLGYAAGPRTVIGPIADLLSQIHGSPSSIAQAAGIEALEGDQSFLEANREVFQTRRDLVVKRANEIPGLSCVSPSGTFYAYINCGPWLGSTSAGGRQLHSDMDVAEALISEAEIAVVPGQVFGLGPYFRVSYALDLKTLQKAMDRIDRFARALQRK